MYSWNSSLDPRGELQTGRGLTTGDELAGVLDEEVAEVVACDTTLGVDLIVTGATTDVDLVEVVLLEVGLLTVEVEVDDDEVVAAEPSSSAGEFGAAPSSPVEVVAAEPSSLVGVVPTFSLSEPDPEVESSPPVAPESSLVGLELGLGILNDDDFEDELLPMEDDTLEPDLEVEIEEDTLELDLDKEAPEDTFEPEADAVTPGDFVELLIIELLFPVVLDVRAVSLLQATPMHGLIEEAAELEDELFDETFAEEAVGIVLIEDFEVFEDDFKVVEDDFTTDATLFAEVDEEIFLLDVLEVVLMETFAVVCTTLGVVLMTCTVVFGDVFGVVLITGFAVVLATLTTGICKADFMASEDAEMQLQAAESSEGVNPWMGDFLRLLRPLSAIGSS